MTAIREQIINRVYIDVASGLAGLWPYYWDVVLGKTLMAANMEPTVDHARNAIDREVRETRGVVV